MTLWTVVPIGVLALTAVVSPLSAALLQIGSRADLGANQTIQFSAFGGDLTELSNPFFGEASQGAGVRISSTGSDPLYLLAQGTFNGDFLPGEIVLSAFSFGPSVRNLLRFRFGAPAFAIGAQIQSDLIDTFTAELEAFDALGASIGVVSLVGANTGNGNGSAPFLGARSTMGAFREAEFRIVATGSGNASTLAVGDVGVEVIPEPGTVLLVGVGVAWVVGRRRRAARMSPARVNAHRLS